MHKGGPQAFIGGPEGWDKKKKKRGGPIQRVGKRGRGFHTRQLLKAAYTAMKEGAVIKKTSIRTDLLKSREKK